jgi:hypothetical protein
MIYVGYKKSRIKKDFPPFSISAVGSEIRDKHPGSATLLADVPGITIAHSCLQVAQKFLCFSVALTLLDIQFQFSSPFLFSTFSWAQRKAANRDVCALFSCVPDFLQLYEVVRNL